MKVVDLLNLDHQHARKLVSEVSGALEFRSYVYRGYDYLPATLLDRGDDLYKECCRLGLIHRSRRGFDDRKLMDKILLSLRLLTEGGEQIDVFVDDDEPYKPPIVAPQRIDNRWNEDGSSPGYLNLTRDELDRRVVLLERLLGFVHKSPKRRALKAIRIEDRRVLLMINTGRRMYEFAFPLEWFER